MNIFRKWKVVLAFFHNYHKFNEKRRHSAMGVTSFLKGVISEDGERVQSSLM